MRLFVPVSLILVCSVFPVRADLSWQSAMKVAGPLAPGGGGVIQAKCAVSGERQRCDTAASDEILQTLSKDAGEEATRIVRIDEGKVYSIRGDGAVLEETFAERKARIERLAGASAEEWRLEEASAKIEPTKTFEELDGMECEDVKVVVTGVLIPGEGQKVPVALEADVWVTSSFAGRSEMDGFSRKEAAAFGLPALQPRLLALIDPHHRAIVREFARALGTVGGTPIRIGATLYGSQAGALQSQAEARRTAAASAGGGGGLVEMSPEQRGGLVTRRDRGGPVSVRGPRAGDWSLSLQVTGIDAAAVEASRFEPPAGARKLIPKSRRKDGEPAEKPMAGELLSK